MTIRHLVLATFVLLTACGDDGSTTEPAPTYNNIAATYSGALSGVSHDGIALNATFSLTINQTRGDLSGSYAMNGVLDDGVSTLDVQGTGSITGTIASGNNPSVNLTLRVGGCPYYEARFSGSYDTTNRRLTISGPVDILNEFCEVAIIYNATIVLAR